MDSTLCDQARFVASSEMESVIVIGTDALKQPSQYPSSVDGQKALFVFLEVSETAQWMVLTTRGSSTVGPYRVLEVCLTKNP